MGNHRGYLLAIAGLGIIVAGLAVWVFVLQKRVAELQSANKDLAQRLDRPDEKPRAGEVAGDGFHDLSFLAAFERANNDDKPVMVFFFSKSSGPSQGMEDWTWKDASINKWLSERTVAIRIDADREPSLAVTSRITSLPVIIFYRPDRSEIDRLVGYHDPTDFLRMAEPILRAFKASQDMK